MVPADTSPASPPPSDRRPPVATSPRGSSLQGAEAWDAYTEAYQREAQISTSSAGYGPDIPTEADLRLLGDLRGKRVLELGCGGAQASISFVKQGATAIGVDYSAEQLAYARRLCDAEEVRVELRQGDLADLAFMRADSMDLAFSSYVFNYVEDLNRVFRQVHRVLKVGAPLVFSVPHPAYDMIDTDSDPDTVGAASHDPDLAGASDRDIAATSAAAASGPMAAAPVLTRPYFDRSPIRREVGGVVLTEFPRTFADVYMGLARASYRVDLVLEPPPIAAGPRSSAYRPAMAVVPRTLIIRARKEGN